MRLFELELSLSRLRAGTGYSKAATRIVADRKPSACVCFLRSLFCISREGTHTGAFAAVFVWVYLEHPTDRGVQLHST